MNRYPPANAYGQVPIGAKGDRLIYVSENLLAQKSIKEIRKVFGLTKRYPVRTDLSGSVVMVEAESQEEAINIYLRTK